jgi:hypothetical protein
MRANRGSLLVAGLFIGCVTIQPVAATARGGGHSSSGSHSSSHSTSSSSSTHVRGYTTKKGTYVAPHERSKADHDFSNNWSTKGNTNPTTGKAGTHVSPPGQPSGTLHSSGGTFQFSPGVTASGIVGTSGFSGGSNRSRSLGPSTSGGVVQTQTGAMEGEAPRDQVAAPAEPANSRVRQLATPVPSAAIDMAHYRATLSNARSLIRAGLYGPAETYLRRIMDGAPGTPLAAMAQAELDRLPTH